MPRTAKEDVQIVSEYQIPFCSSHKAIVYGFRRLEVHQSYELVQICLNVFESFSFPISLSLRSVSRRVWSPPQRPFRVCSWNREVKKGITAGTIEELQEKVWKENPSFSSTKSLYIFDHAVGHFYTVILTSGSSGSLGIVWADFGVWGRWDRGGLRWVPHSPAGQHRFHGPEPWRDLETSSCMYVCLCQAETIFWFHLELLVALRCFILSTLERW